MNYSTGIQKAIDYIEEHLTEEIDFEQIAKQAYFSGFHFQRLFSLLCGITLGDYIRFRRLSCAAEELARTDEKIIDVAFQYGYDSPESFSRAFKSFHGITPSQVKNGAPIKNFSRLSVKLILSGGTIMDYRIERVDELKIVCKRKQFKKQQEYTTVAISAFWDECGKDGTIEKLCGCIPENPRLKGLLGVCFDGEGGENEFPYAIATEFHGEEAPEGLELVTIPAARYAAFPVRGKMPDAYVRTYEKIVKEFFVQSGYEYGNTFEFEVYPTPDAGREDYYCEIWVALADSSD